MTEKIDAEREGRGSSDCVEQVAALSDQPGDCSGRHIAWQILLKTKELINLAVSDSFYLGYDLDTQQVVPLAAWADDAYLWRSAQGKLCFSPKIPAEVTTFFDLYLPVLEAQSADVNVVAHLGQSIDSRIATLTGDSIFVTGEENRKHLHCLRALSDAVIVGAGTVLHDNPQLTTRSVAGDNPVRVIIDPRAGLATDYKLFNDGQSRTLLIHQSSADLSSLPSRFGPPVSDAQNQSELQVERCPIPDTDEELSPASIIAYLSSRGLRRLFVEGGGLTVSRFFNNNVLDRLHIAVAPLLVGEGIQALQLPGLDRMGSAHRPAHAIYKMGEDILWDFDVSKSSADQAGTDSDESLNASTKSDSLTGVQRIG